MGSSVPGLDARGIKGNQTAEAHRVQRPMGPPARCSYASRDHARDVPSVASIAASPGAGFFCVGETRGVSDRTASTAWCVRIRAVEPRIHPVVARVETIGSWSGPRIRPQRAMNMRPGEGEPLAAGKEAVSKGRGFCRAKSSRKPLRQSGQSGGRGPSIVRF